MSPPPERGAPAGPPGPLHYTLAGLRVRSVLPLPAPLAGPAGEPDVEVREAPLPPPASPPPEGGAPLVEGDEADARLYWAGAGALAVRGGAEITVSRAEGVTPAMVAPLVLGVGMGLLLHQRGRLVLHASAVALPGGTVAFVGPKEAGKSTTAGALLARGHRLVTDDALPIEAPGDGAPVAWPGPTQLKLWPESAEALGLPPEGLARLHPLGSKRVLAAPPEAGGPSPLRAIYVLGPGADALAIEPIQGQWALLELLRHAYAPRFVPAAGTSPAHFERCARVAAAVPVFHLLRVPGLERLAEIAAAVEAHAATLGEGGPAPVGPPLRERRPRATKG